MVMETPEGDWDVQPFTPGSVLYVPPALGAPFGEHQHG